jgi:hypothetical protein
LILAAIIELFLLRWKEWPKVWTVTGSRKMMEEGTLVDDESEGVMKDS